MKTDFGSAVLPVEISSDDPTVSFCEGSSIIAFSSKESWKSDTTFHMICDEIDNGFLSAFGNPGLRIDPMNDNHQMRFIRLLQNEYPAKDTGNDVEEAAPYRHAPLRIVA